MSRRLDPENFCAEKLAWHKRIMRDPAVSRSAKSVVSLLVHDLNPCVGGAWRGQDSMAASLGLSDRQLRRLLKQLETAAYLQIEVRKGRSRTNIYRASRTPTAARSPPGSFPASRVRFTANDPADPSESRRPSSILIVASCPWTPFWRPENTCWITWE